MDDVERKATYMLFWDNVFFATLHEHTSMNESRLDSVTEAVRSANAAVVARKEADGQFDSSMIEDRRRSVLDALEKTKRDTIDFDSRS